MEESTLTVRKRTALWGHQWELNLAWGSWRTSYQLENLLPAGDLLPTDASCSGVCYCAILRLHSPSLLLCILPHNVSFIVMYMLCCLKHKQKPLSNKNKYGNTCVLKYLHHSVPHWDLVPSIRTNLNTNMEPPQTVTVSPLGRKSSIGGLWC